MSSHPDIDRARRTAGAFRVMPSERGFHVWRFRPWSERCGGWRIVVSDLKTREDAWLHVLSRLGLLSEAPPQPLPPQDVKVSWADPEWF